MDKSRIFRINMNPDGKDIKTCPTPPVPPSPQLNINRSAYNLSNFNETFEIINEKKSNLSQKFYYHFKPNLTLNVLKTSAKNYFPIINWLSNYDYKNCLLADILVGITVAVFQVPQSMGYCFIAHVPAVYGLYTAFFPALVYSLLGTSRHSAVGAFAIVSGVMTGNLVMNVMLENNISLETKETFSSAHIFSNTTVISTPAATITTITRDSNSIPNLQSIEIANAISLSMGIYMLIFGILKLGFISIYLSEQLISGFSTAASLYVFTSQLRYLFGVHLKYQSGLFAIINYYIDLINKINEINMAAVLISMISISVLLSKIYLNKFLEKVNIKVPFPIDLLVVIFGVLASQILNLHERFNVQIVGTIKKGLPSPQMPRLDVLQAVWLRSIPFAIVGFTIALSVGKLFGTRHGYQIDPNQELIALGVCNLVGSTFSCLPSAASLPRSAVQENAGGKTQLVSIVNCVSMLIVLLYLGPFLEKLPNCVLASIIAVALKSLLAQSKQFQKYWQISKLDGSVWMVSFLGVIILDVDLGLYVGLLYSLLVLIYKSSRPKTYLLGSVDKSDVYVPLKKYMSATEIKGIKIYQFCGPLHFASSEYFKNDMIKKIGYNLSDLIAEKNKHKKKAKFKSTGNSFIYSIEETNAEITNANTRLTKFIIIDCSMFSYIDCAGVTVLKKIVQEFAAIGVKIFLAGCASHVINMLEKDNFFEEVPQNHVYISVHDAVLHAIDDIHAIDTESTINKL